MIGQMISHYRVVAKLGEGGMGVVYRAEDLALGRTVALKFLPPDSATREEDRARLVQEARAAAALLHPNICPVHEIAEADGRTFIVMSCLEGRSLRDRLREGPVGFDEALSIASQVGAALVAAHARGIVHRDVKPANVMLVPDEGEGAERAVLMDFGLARVGDATRLTETGTTPGTPAYMAPEQVLGQAIDQRTDVWALGVLLHEMLTGRPPFRGDYAAALAHAIVHDELAPLAGAAGDLPAGLDGVLARALAKDADRRYRCVADLLRDLATLAADRRALPAGRARRERGLQARWRRWRPAQRAAAVGAAAILLAAVAWGVAQLALSPPRIDSLAVLPLADLSGAPDQQYFADGMTDELIGQLGKIRALKVISRTSSMSFKGVERPLPEIARVLDVGAVLEGSVRQAGDRVRISLRLVDARTDRGMWADTYDVTLADVFSAQRDVALQVVQALRVSLSPDERDRLDPRRPASAEAYRLYLKGNFFLHKQTAADTRKGIGLFEEALGLDPRFAPAYSALAKSYWMLSTYGHLSPAETYPKARECALKALALDESLTQAHTALAQLSSMDWDWQAGEREFARALELGSTTAYDHDAYAFFLLQVGRGEEAVAQARRAVQLDPLVVALWQDLGEVLYYARRHDESIEIGLEALEMDPAYPQINMFLGMAYAAKGMRQEAVQALDRERDLSGGRKPQVESWLGVAYALAGQADQARRIRAAMQERSRSEFISPFPQACICFVLGETERGFAWLAEGFARRDPRMSYLKVHPACDSVRSDPRYLACLERIGLGS